MELSASFRRQAETRYPFDVFPAMNCVVRIGSRAKSGFRPTADRLVPTGQSPEGRHVSAGVYNFEFKRSRFFI
jgi:hypothetical protein